MEARVVYLLGTLGVSLWVRLTNYSYGSDIDNAFLFTNSLTSALHGTKQLIIDIDKWGVSVGRDMWWMNK